MSPCRRPKAGQKIEPIFPFHKINKIIVVRQFIWNEQKICIKKEEEEEEEEEFSINGHLNLLYALFK